MSMFRVLDTRTGKYVRGFRDMEDEVMHDDGPRGQYAGLVWCDLCGWLLDDEGDLFLSDSCGNYAAAPEHFKVIYDQTWISERTGDR